jgi:predicted lactoylglutathione lyase
MTPMIFVNLPVVDLAKARGFYEALGFTHNPAFSDDAGACMVLSESIYVMILTHPKWQGFTTRPICPAGSSEVSLALAVESKDEVNRLVAAGAAAGGSADVNPPEDHGFMFQRTIADPDGHIWEPFWMDQAAVPGEAA